MQKSSNECNYQDRVDQEPVALVSQTLDKLALTWSIGIGIGYAFLVSFICWIVYRCFSHLQRGPGARLFVHR